MADFPSTVKNFATLIDLVDSVLAAHQNERGDEITAIEDFLLNTLILVDGMGYNYKISPTISSNNLTVSILRPDGSAPTVDSPMRFRIGDDTYTVSTSTSFTVNSGTNLMNLGSTDLIGNNSVDVFLYVIGETGSSVGAKFGFSRIPYATSMANFVNTATDERYIVGNYAVWNDTDQVRVIGRFRVSLSSGTYLWSIPSSKVVNRPIFETDWLYYTPAVTGISSQDTTHIWRYQIRNKEATVFGRQNANTTSNATGFGCPLPISCRVDLSQAMAWSSVCLLVEGATSFTGLGRVLSSSPTVISFLKSDGSAVWAGTGNKRIAQMSPMLYEI